MQTDTLCYNYTTQLACLQIYYLPFDFNYFSRLLLDFFCGKTHERNNICIPFSSISQFIAKFIVFELIL